MTSKIKVIAILICFSFTASAQNEVDALRYSQVTFGGTARFNALGGAFGALGGDLSVSSTNPAGLSIYRASEFSFTPAVFTQRTRSTHYGNTAEDGKANFNFGNIGVVFTDLKNPNGYSEWAGSHLSFTYNRHNDFNNRQSISGMNPSSSLLDHYVSQINGLNPADVYNADQFGSSLAWNTFLINPIDTVDTTTYIGVIGNGGIEQKKHIIQRGGMGEFDISISGNYNNKFYIGGTLGFPMLNYEEESTYTETDVEDTIAYFKSFDLKQKLYTSGTGFNFKLGMIFRPVDWMRLGGAIHTPTYWKLKDEYSSDISATFDSVPPWTTANSQDFNASSPEGVYDYRLYTPWRLIGSMAIIIDKKGLISVDYEFIDYSSARLRGEFYGFDAENASIDQKYTHATNIRVGTEWRFQPFSIRGGYALYGSPFKGGLNTGTRENYSFGFGIRESDFYIDFAYIFSQTSSDYFLYSGDLVDATLTESESHTFQTTLGFRF